MLRFSANLGFLWKDLPLLDRIRAARAAGFDAVEFHFPYDVPAENVRQLLSEMGLPAIGLNTRPGDSQAGDFGLAALPGREAEARAVIDEAFRYARAIGAGYVHVMAGKPGGSEGGAARRVYLDALDHAAALAEAAGIAILIEPLNQRDVPGYFLHANAQAADIIAELGRENLKLMFDCYHAQVSQGDLTRQIEKLLPVIGHIQIAAVPSRAEPDEGEIACERLLKAVASMGYAGFIGAEYRPRAGIEDGLGWLDRFRDALSR